MQITTTQKRAEYKKIINVATAEGLLPECERDEFHTEIDEGVYDYSPKFFVASLRLWLDDMDVVISLLERVLKLTAKDYKETMARIGRVQATLA